MAQAEPPLQSFFRLCIMLGATVVVGMAVYVYGPPADQLAPTLDRIISSMSELVATTHQKDGASLSMPGPTPSFATGALQPLGDAPFQNNQVTPAAAFAQRPSLPTSLPTPIPTTEAMAPSSLEQLLEAVPSLASLIQQLQSSGADDMQLTLWGAEGKLHRFCCSAPVTLSQGSESGFRQHFDAIGPSPAKAIEQVALQLQQWRMTNSLPITQ